MIFEKDVTEVETRGLYETYTENPERTFEILTAQIMAGVGEIWEARKSVLNALNYELDANFYSHLDGLVHSTHPIDIFLLWVFMNRTHKDLVTTICDVQNLADAETCSDISEIGDVWRAIPVRYPCLIDLIDQDFVVPYIGDHGFQWVLDRGKKFFTYIEGASPTVHYINQGTAPSAFDLRDWVSLYSTSPKVSPPEVTGLLGTHPIIYTSTDGVGGLLRAAQTSRFGKDTTVLGYCVPGIEHQWLSLLLLTHYEEQTPRPMVAIYTHKGAPVVILGKNRFLSMFTYNEEHHRIISGSDDILTITESILPILEEIGDCDSEDMQVRELVKVLDSQMEGRPDIKYGYRRDKEKTDSYPTIKSCRLGYGTGSEQLNNITSLGRNPLKTVLRGFSNAFDPLTHEVIVEAPSNWDLATYGNLSIIPRPVSLHIMGEVKNPEFVLSLPSPPPSLEYYGCSLHIHNEWYSKYPIKPTPGALIIHAHTFKGVEAAFEILEKQPYAYGMYLWFDPHPESVSMSKLSHYKLKLEVANRCEKYGVFWLDEFTEEGYAGLFCEGNSKYLRVYSEDSIMSKWMPELFDIACAGNEVMVCTDSKFVQLPPNLTGDFTKMADAGLLVSYASDPSDRQAEVSWLGRGKMVKPQQSILDLIQNYYTWGRAWDKWAKSAL